MYELRVLSGLHRGATLPLDDRPHRIGASEDADVVLVDPGIEASHGTLQLRGDGWVLSTLDGAVRSAESNRSEVSITLSPGEFARLGEVWLTVVKEGSPWENPPAAPTDEAGEEAFDDASEEHDTARHADVIGVEEFAPAGEGDAAPDGEGDADRISVNDLVGTMEPDAGMDEVPASNPPTKPAGFLRRLCGRPAIAIPLAATVLSAAAAYAITSKPDTAISSSKVAALARSPAAAKASGMQTDKTLAAAFDSLNEDGTATRPLTQDELQKAFRKRLQDADLLKRFDLTMQSHQWTMQAALDDEEAARFERILASFVKTHQIAFPIQARVGNAESMLPFKIRQVVSGANASVVVDDGDRLYVGDEFHGVRLMAVQSNKLVFAGKRKIEVRW